MYKFFIFTNTPNYSTACFIAEGDNVTKAISAFKKMKHPRAGEIVGVIKAASEFYAYGRGQPTHVLGVVCAFAEMPSTPAAAATTG
jgi:hypothetical protein